jgi:DNA primase
MVNKFLVNCVKNIPIMEVIGYYDLDVKKGYLLCPFHNEKTPSAKIYEDTNTIYCFGLCQRHFDSIDIVRKMENFSFEKAVLFLYQNFVDKIFVKIKDTKNLSLYKRLNDEFRNIIMESKKNRKKIMKMMQTVDLNAENNLLILKIYKNILRLAEND